MIVFETSVKLLHDAISKILLNSEIIKEHGVKTSFSDNEKIMFISKDSVVELSCDISEESISGLWFKCYEVLYVELARIKDRKIKVIMTEQAFILIGL